jgi:nitrite reductase (NADH) small subunit
MAGQEMGAGERQNSRGSFFNVEGTFHAIDTHRRVPLGERGLEVSVVTCPWHGWQFEVTTGTCMANPAAIVDRYDVLVEGANVKVLL